MRAGSMAFMKLAEICKCMLLSTVNLKLLRDRGSLRDFRTSPTDWPAASALNGSSL